MSQELPMTVTSVKSLGLTTPKNSTNEIIEISDSEDDLEGQCRAFSNGNCRRQAGQKRKHAQVTPDAKIPNGNDSKRLRALLSNPMVDSHGLIGGNSAQSEQAHVVVKGVPDENNSRIRQTNHNQKVFRRPLNGSATPTTPTPLSRSPAPLSAGVTSSRSSQCSCPVNSQNQAPGIVPRMKEERGDDTADLRNSFITDEVECSANKVDAVTCKREPDESSSVGATSIGGSIRNQRQFLKPPSPRVALSKNDFQKMPLEDVDDLIAKYGPHLIQNVTIKDICGKAIGEMKLPKNLKVTPQLNQKRLFKEPISADDEVIVISDDERIADSVSQHVADSSPEPETDKIKCDFKAKMDFLANLQLFHDFKKRRPLKRDIATVLKTRNIMKAYIANPHVSLIKANCIYKYVTSKGILSSEQFRARKEAPRRKKKAATDAPKSKRAASRADHGVAPKPTRRATPASGMRRSIRKRAVRIANQPHRLTRHFFTTKFKENIAGYEREGVWTSYSVPEVARTVKVPMIILTRVNPEDWKTAATIEPATRDSHIAKEHKCRWCLFHCLNIPSLREHCFDFHGKIFPAVI